RRLTKSRATEPATETLPLADPEAAWAWKLWLESVPTVVMVASPSREPALTVVPAGRSTTLLALARLIATPAPLEVVLPAAADPSAVAVACVLAEVLKTTAPRAVRVRPEGVPERPAWEVALAMLIPIAAATGTWPSLVWAEGAGTEPEPAPGPR